MWNLNTAFQCYQCTHNDVDQNIDCVNADAKYLQNCTIESKDIRWNANQGKKMLKFLFLN